MSRDLSMFKKMKERITDEVNSATNKLQNMQIIDQLASTIGQQMTKNESTPNQLLPEFQEPSSNSNISQSSRNNSNNKFSLIDDSPPVAGFNEDEELNTEISPQHELFDENTIRRLKSTKNGMSNTNNQPQTQQNNNQQATSKKELQSVINNINELNSDIEEDSSIIGDEIIYHHNCKHREDDLDDVEIDLLSDKPIQDNTDNNSNVIDKNQLAQFKTKYRLVVRALRKLNHDCLDDKSQLETLRNELNKITASRLELDSKQQNNNSTSTSNQHDSLISISTNVSENDKSSVGSPQPTTKTGQKLKDLEKLLAKCKESLKAKNKKIQSLRDALGEVEKFKEANGELRNELAQLREAHETWTISIAENKRVMHQELEEKNSEIDKLKGETNGLQMKLNDSNNKMKQLKSAIQDLESRLVSTSAAHQKERESLTKDLINQKNVAIKQIQSEHERAVERVKLDLEKTIEALKMDILRKDEQIFLNSKEQQQLQEKNQTLAKELEDFKQKSGLQFDEIQKWKNDYDQYFEKCRTLETELEKLQLSTKDNEQLDLKNKKELEEKIQVLEEKLAQFESERDDREQKLVNIVEPYKSENKVCDQCESYEKTLKTSTEKFQQELHNLNTQLTLINTANQDQEKVILSLKLERDKMIESLKAIKDDFNELQNKNDSLLRVTKENETEIQFQQEKITEQSNIINNLEQEKEEHKRNIISLRDKCSELNNRLDSEQLAYSDLELKLKQTEEQLKIHQEALVKGMNSYQNVKKEKESLVSSNAKLNTKLNELNEQLVMRILCVIKNLETPNTSPGSDKSYNSTKKSSATGSDQLNDTDNGEKSLPDPLVLIEELSSLALDRTNSYMTATQRLQAVLLDNTMLSEEIKRLKEDLNNLNEERTHESQTSVNEVEKLQIENQCLIHDQQSYEDRIGYLENEIEKITKSLNDKNDLLDDIKNEKTKMLELMKADCGLKDEELESLKLQLKDKQKTEEECSKLLDNNEEKLKELEETLMEMKSNYANKEAELIEISLKVDKLNEENRKLIEENGKLIEENGKLNEQSTKSDRIDQDQLNDSNVSMRYYDETKQTNDIEKSEPVDHVDDDAYKSSYPPENVDHTYQIRALKRLLEQYQQENFRLRENQKRLNSKANDDNNDNRNEIIPDSTQFEYLKNIVFQFMLGKEPLVLARVISAVFKFDKNQIDQICKVQEIVQSTLKQTV